jgi:hypothetical protein
MNRKEFEYSIIRRIPLNNDIDKVFEIYASISCAIRMNSAHSSDINPKAHIDVMWLSDVVHNINLFGKSITSSCGDTSSIKSLVHVYTQYLSNEEAMDVFYRWKIHIPELIQALSSVDEHICKLAQEDADSIT